MVAMMIMMVMMIVMLMLIVIDLYGGLLFDDKLMANLVVHSHYTKPNDRRMCIVAQDNNTNYVPPGSCSSNVQCGSLQSGSIQANCQVLLLLRCTFWRRCLLVVAHSRLVLQRRG